MSELSPSLARILAILEEAKGQFVPGQDICKAVGIPMMNLSNFVASLRKARPDLDIIGKKGAGYRLAPAVPAIPEHAAGGREFDPPRKRKPIFRPKQIPAHKRMAASMAMLDLLPAKATEIVKAIALETGETADETMLRLISYGCEVHRDLVGRGENPLGLRAPRTDSKGEVRDGR